MFTSHLECKFQFIYELQVSVQSFQYRSISLICDQIQTTIETTSSWRDYCQSESAEFTTSHIPFISPNIIFIYVLFLHALFWAYVTPVRHIKSAWAGLDVMIFYCSLYYWDDICFYSRFQLSVVRLRHCTICITIWHFQKLLSFMVTTENAFSFSSWN